MKMNMFLRHAEDLLDEVALDEVVAPDGVVALLVEEAAE